MISRTLHALTRALSPGLRRLSHVSSGGPIEDGSDSAHLTGHASLYVHVSRLGSIVLIGKCSCRAERVRTIRGKCFCVMSAKFVNVTSLLFLLPL